MFSQKQRQYFLRTDRIGFSKWECTDADLAQQLWGNPEVTRYICSTGTFCRNDISRRLHAEIENYEKFQVQYWPVFEIVSGELIGCCGLRPHAEHSYEIGFHLLPDYWGKGYAAEAAKAVMDFAFETLHASMLFAGHNPNNIASQKRLLSLGFAYIGDKFYEPTGLYHPSYELKKIDYAKCKT